MSSPKTLNCKCTTVPAASETVSVLDSTYGLITGSQASMNASTGTYLTPGRFRGRWPKPVLTVTAKCTTQNITILFEILTGDAGTSADWETQGTLGSQTVTAGTTFTYEWKPLALDWRIRYTGGATPPGAVTVKVSGVLPTTDYGS